jgi:hypothetical protein
MRVAPSDGCSLAVRAFLWLEERRTDPLGEAGTPFCSRRSPRAITVGREATEPVPRTARGPRGRPADARSRARALRLMKSNLGGRPVAPSPLGGRAAPKPRVCSRCRRNRSRRRLRSPSSNVVLARLDQPPGKRPGYGGRRGGSGFGARRRSARAGGCRGCRAAAGGTRGDRRTGRFRAPIARTSAPRVRALQNLAEVASGRRPRHGRDERQVIRLAEARVRRRRPSIPSLPRDTRVPAGRARRRLCVRWCPPVKTQGRPYDRALTCVVGGNSAGVF